MKRTHVALAVLLLVASATLSGCLVPYPDEDEHGGRDGYYNHEQYRDGEHHRHDDRGEGRDGYRHEERRGDDEEHH